MLQSVRKPSLHGFVCRAEIPHRTSDPYYDIFAEQVRLSDRLHREIDAAQQKMDAEFDAAMKMQRAAEAETNQQAEGPVTSVRIREWKSESGYGKVTFTESVTVFGPSTNLNSSLYHTNNGFAPASPLVLIACFLFGFWITFTGIFSRGYHLTRYGENWRWLLCLLWPVLALISPAFREEFKNAMRGFRRNASTYKQGISTLDGGLNTSAAATGGNEMN